MNIIRQTKKLWGRLPKLPRGWRIVRNLVVSVCVIFTALQLLEWPSLSFYGAFQRLEGAYLLTPSHLVRRVGRASQNRISYLTEGESWIAVGTTIQFTNMGNLLNLDKFRPVLHQVLPKEGVQVVPIPTKTEEGGLLVAVWGAPEGTVGTMELDVMGIDDPTGTREVDGLEVFAAQGVWEGEWMFFHFLPHNNHPTLQACALDMQWFWNSAIHAVGEYPYRLRLTDGQGTEVMSLSGNLPEDQYLMQW